MKSAAQVRVGAIGTGRIFNYAHLPVYPALFDKARLVGFFDLSQDRAEQTRAGHERQLRELVDRNPGLREEVEQHIESLRTYDSLDELLAAVDVVDITTHARGRMATAMSAFSAGVSAMAEKPMARTWTEAERAIRALDAANSGIPRTTGGDVSPDRRRQARPVIFQLNDDNVFDPKYCLIRAMLRSGVIGKVQHIALIRGCGAHDDNLLPAEVTALENGGGALMAYGSHGLAGALSLLWPEAVPVAVEAVSIRTLQPERAVKGNLMHLDVDDNAQLKVRIEDLHTGTWTTLFFEATIVGGHIGLSPTHGGGQSSGYIRIIGDEGMIESESSSVMTITSWNGGVEEIPLTEYPGESISFRTEMGEFFDAYRAGDAPEFDARFGADVIAACGAAYLSAKEGGVVSLDQFKAYSRQFIDRLGDTAAADDAIILDLLAPYRR